MRLAICLSVLTLSACAAPGGPYPSLQPRAAEAVDPRVPVVRPLNERPVSALLAARLAALVEQAQSETWIAAQEALTAAIAARRPTATALGDIDEIAATSLQTNRGIAPNDLAAIQRAAAEVGTLDRRQAERVDAIQRRLAG
jgi:hypothetical protein